MWSEDSDTRIVWVTMLALKNQFHEVHSSVPGLARAANVTLEKTIKALDILRSPDPHSRTQLHEGRRISDIPGGWMILNGEHYRKLMSVEERREYKRIKEAERRERLRGQRAVHDCPQMPQRGQKSAYADTDTDTDTKAMGDPPRGDARGEISPAQLVVYDRELARVQAAMDDIRCSYSEHQSWSEDDIDKFRGFKTRKAELRKILKL